MRLTDSPDHFSVGSPAAEVISNFIPIGKFGRFGKQGKRNKRSRAETPTRDRSGRVHGRPLPSRDDVRRMSTDDLQFARRELKGSRRARHGNQSRFKGKNRAKDRSHGQRIADEERVLRWIENELKSRGQ